MKEENLSLSFSLQPDSVNLDVREWAASKPSLVTKQTLRPEEPENAFVELLADLAMLEIWRGRRHRNIACVFLICYCVCELFFHFYVGSGLLTHIFRFAWHVLSPAEPSCCHKSVNFFNGIG